MAPSNVAPAGAPVNHPPQVALPPRMVPNSRRLDDSFPVLGFNIFCDHAAWFEVLLSTDRALFDPANASRRKPDNFYSSRQDSRLIPIQLGSAIYLAPAAVLRGFTGATPRPSEIYYTVAAYADAQGSNPVFAQPAETLAASAPSVAISRHYGSDGGWSAFGMDPGKLHRWQPPAIQPSGKPVSGLSLAAVGLSDEEDRAGGEDGRYAAPPEPVNARPQEADYTGYEEAQKDHEPPHYGDSRAAAAAESDYEDGYGQPPPPSDLVASLAQQTSFRPGEAEPQELEDGDGEEDGRGYAARGATPGNSYSGATAYDSDDDAPGYTDGRSEGLGNAYSVARYGNSDDDDDDDESSSRSYRAAGGGGSNGSRFYAASPSAVSAGTTYGDEAEEGNWSAEGSQSMAAVAAPPALAPKPAPSAPEAPLTVEKKRDLIGKLGDYTAISADAEFNGVLGPDHPAYRRHHLGLSFGIVGFNQDTGHLGQLLLAMRERDAAKFAEIFGPDAESLLRITTTRGPRSMESREGRSARVQPVSGADLWQDPWLARFREAGAYKPFQAVQNRLAAEWFLDPLLGFAHRMGLNTERALAMAMDRASQMGVAASEQWIANSCGPLQTPQQRQQALAALGFSDLGSFQAAHAGLESDGQWGPRTHAALVEGLRDGGRSPVPLPALDQMLDALVRRAAQSPWFARMQALRNDVRLGDTAMHLGHPRHDGAGKQPQR